GQDAASQGKRHVPDRWHFLRAFACIVLSVCGCLSITPPSPETPLLDIPWRLGPRNQIVIIGLLLTIMSQFCAKPVVTDAFLALEATHDKEPESYRAILTDSILGTPHWRWRIPLLVWALVPAALSVGYKQFVGGEVRLLWEPSVSADLRKYGVDFPRIGEWSPPNDSIFLLLTSFAPFQTATDHGNADYPQTFPQVYGYNTLLLNNDSAAILDIPTGPYMRALQSELTQGSHLVLEADVDAYVATFNTSTANDEDLWDAAFNQGFGETGLSTMSLYKGNWEALGMMPFGEPASSDNNRMFVGMYYNATYMRGMHADRSANSTEAERFRPRAQLYNIDRQRCRGTWELNDTSILLIDGKCDGVSVDSSVLRRIALDPFPYDILPPMVHVYEHLIRTGEDSPWLRATYSVSVATMYWARALYMFNRDRPGPAYAPREETVYLVKPALRDHPLLYGIMGFLPVVTLMALVCVWWPGVEVPELVVVRNDKIEPQK
ncbi:hypothetical protein F5X68DRAFT_252337, partial [Plectosphaerella plurivora]